MTTAVNEILKQTKMLSAKEQLELANKLMEQAQQNADATPRNSCQNEGFQAEPFPPIGGAQSLSEEDEEWLDAFSLKRVPPTASYEIKVKFVDGGRGQPRRYDFGDLFDDEMTGGIEHVNI